MLKQSRKIILFDRDGTLNQDDNGHTFKIEDFRWIMGAYEAIIFCKERGFKVAVISNQSGVAKGIYNRESVAKFNSYMNQLLPKNAQIDAFYFCPHHPEGSVKEFTQTCLCRKPKPGLILRALKDFSLEGEEAIFFGNSESDLIAGQSAFVDSFLYQEGSLLEFVQKSLDL